MSMLEFSLTGVGNLIESVHKNFSSVVLSYPCSNHYSCSEFSSIFPRGRFFLEVWGGDGGHVYQAASGSSGGYSCGILTLEKPTTVFIAIGAKGGTYDSYTTSYNGGGMGFSGWCMDMYFYSTNGGGGTDIRILSNSNENRVIVAGGGGGTGIYDEIGAPYDGGVGGGISGTDGQYVGCGGKGGSQYSGGARVSGASSQGEFGRGGSSNVAGYYGCGGGGGWYGGSSSCDWTAGGGGGSGYVLTSTSHIPTGYVFDHSSSYILEGAQTLSGSESVHRPNNLKDNGCVRITVLSASNLILSNSQSVLFHLCSSYIIMILHIFVSHVSP